MLNSGSNLRLTGGSAVAYADVGEELMVQDRLETAATVSEKQRLAEPRDVTLSARATSKRPVARSRELAAEHREGDECDCGGVLRKERLTNRALASVSNELAPQQRPTERDAMTS
jgi:hypothetical protein